MNPVYDQPAPDRLPALRAEYARACTVMAQARAGSAEWRTARSDAAEAWSALEAAGERQEEE